MKSLVLLWDRWDWGLLGFRLLLRRRVLDLRSLNRKLLDLRSLDLRLLGWNSLGLRLLSLEVLGLEVLGLEVLGLEVLGSRVLGLRMLLDSTLLLLTVQRSKLLLDITSPLLNLRLLGFHHLTLLRIFRHLKLMEKGLVFERSSRGRIMMDIWRSGWLLLMESLLGRLILGVLQS